MAAGAARHFRRHQAGRGRTAPFRELAAKGPIPAGGAALTGAGKLPFRAIIHVAGLNLFWFSSEEIVRGCVRSALKLAGEAGLRSVAFPLIGSGTGGLSEERSLQVIREEAGRSGFPGEVRLVRYPKAGNARDCFCDRRHKDPGLYDSQGIPPGYCGVCEKCGRPGHTRHFPGAVPYTGAWCDRHYRLLSLLHPLCFPGGLLYFLVFFSLFVLSLLRR